MNSSGKLVYALGAAILLATDFSAPAADDPLVWPPVTAQQKPWAYNWWMGSAVDKTNLTRELERYAAAGLGGIHIIPIYGAKGYESKYITCLSPQWMDMMGWAVSEARRLGMDVDMTTGTGWCFGGPQVTDEDANASVVVKTYELGVGETIRDKIKRDSIQALVAFTLDGKFLADLTDSVSTNGDVGFSPGGNWIGTTNSAPPKIVKVFAISQKPSGQKVKPAAPGGEGWMLNPIHPPAMDDFLKPFTAAFASYTGSKPRAQYHDSYEYQSDWSPDFFAEFEKRRGYKLQTELPALFGGTNDDHSARVKCDYRQTVSEIMAQESLPKWTQWAHSEGCITRDQAHGSPGNWLDLYATADIPETEMSHTDRNPLISKFASSAAHVNGKPLVSAETGTWLGEHFTVTLGELKSLADDMFLSGVNHIFYHGCCYSPDEAGWPGWCFYASTEMNPRNSIWRDVPALNEYIARCQSILQSGAPDNDILLYWPIEDFWMQSGGRLLPQLTVSNTREWFDTQPIGKTAKELSDQGYAFDYVSDVQLKTAEAEHGLIHLPHSREYSVVLVPKCKYIPLETFKLLLALAQHGARVVFEEQLPEDISGLVSVEKRDEFKRMITQIPFRPASVGIGTVEASRFGNNGYIVKGDLRPALLSNAVGPQSALAFSGLDFVRRTFPAGGWNYFIANHSGTNFDGWIPFGPNEKSAVLLDPMSGTIGVAATRQNQLVTSIMEIHLQLLAGESVILRTLEYKKAEGPAWNYWQPQTPDAKSQTLTGPWNVKFIEGGPVLPADFQTAKLASWTTFPDTNTQAFAGTAKYETTFDAPDSAGKSFEINLGDVRQSARVRVNGQDYGTLITPPFRVVVDNLKPAGNQLEVDVTSVAANRIRDLDRRGVLWKIFRDINFVDINYKPFNASNWPLTDCGLLGPVKVTAMTAIE